MINDDVAILILVKYLSIVKKGEGPVTTVFIVGDSYFENSKLSK